MYYLCIMEETIKSVLQIDDLWNTRRDRTYVWGRMIFVYYFIYVQKRTIEELISLNLMTINQVYYLIRKSRYNMEKNQYFKSFYIKVLGKMLDENYNLVVFRYD